MYMAKILYVHDFGEIANDYNSFKLSQIRVNDIFHAPGFLNDYNKLKDNVSKIEKTVKSIKNFDFIIGTGFGALSVLLYHDLNIPKILINPMLLPYTYMQINNIPINDEIKKIEFDMINIIGKNTNTQYVMSEYDNYMSKRDLNVMDYLLSVNDKIIFNIASESHRPTLDHLNTVSFIIDIIIKNKS